jgi:hypothetical protein
MPDFTVRSDSVNVEQLMEQIRARIREKRGVDYTEQQIQDLANVKLEKFLDPHGVRSDLLEQYRHAQPPYTPPELPNYSFEDHTLFESHRAPLRFIRRLLNPLLKLFFNPNPLIQALNIQARLNTMTAERLAKQEASRHTSDQLHYELTHNLVLETTRLGIEVKNLKMRVESLTSRLEFNERRARALESVVVYKPDPENRVQPSAGDLRDEPAVSDESNLAPGSPSTQAGSQPQGEGPGQKSRRRRRRRGRRGSGSVAALMGEPSSDAGGDPTVPGEIEGSDDDAALEAGDDAPRDAAADRELRATSAPEAETAPEEPGPDSSEHES